MQDFAFDWTKFKKKIFIKAGVEEVFRHWVIPENITKWFIASADYVTPTNSRRQQSDFVQAGDKYNWKWHQELEMEGEILSIRENRMFQFTFGENNQKPGEKIIVTVSFQEAGDETLLELVQENMPDTLDSHVNWYMSCNLGWTFFITNLKAVLEHGVDLREMDEERAGIARATTHD